jgi:glycosyltransferase involved in cell wall biosynthesis
MSGTKSKLCVLILTHNESRHLARALASVAPIADDVLVVDSFSTDDTTAIAESAGARVMQNKFVNYSKQFQWGLDNGEINSRWVMRLDADEVIEPDLAAAIAEFLANAPDDVAGVNFDRKHIFMGRWIRHGGRYPLRLLRMWRNGQGRIEDRWMDEHMVVWGGRTITLKGGFSDINLNDLTFFTEKHNKYATREAIDVLASRYGLIEADASLNAKSASLQASLKRGMKERVYNQLPFWVGPVGYFVYRFIFQLGFLDGRPGLIYHGLQGLWYRFLVAAKVEELDAAIRDCADNEARRQTLSRLTGHTLIAPK